MKTEELKKELIDRIKRTEDISLLEDIYKLTDPNLFGNIVYKLTPEEDESLTAAREEVKKGQYLTQEEVDEKTKKWLEE